MDISALFELVGAGVAGGFMISAGVNLLGIVTGFLINLIGGKKT